MFTEVYTVYDKIAMESGPVFHAKNEGIAKRQYIQLMSGGVSGVPEDYRLLKLGTYDHDSCKGTWLDVPEEIHVAIAKRRNEELRAEVEGE